jgi:hypothetical protein
VLELATAVVLIGVGATAFTDLWVMLRKRVFGVPLPDYGHVGRWIAYLFRGRFFHDAIARTPAVEGERLIGWGAHYLIGIAFAAILPSIWGPQWLRTPTLLAALIVGVGTVAAPFFVMQPAMGAGVAASRAPNPAVARTRSIVMHAVFGLGLYAAACMLSAIPHW